jgi:aryl-alcohol dehydrogenase-like predicted oxidoreductase
MILRAPFGSTGHRSSRVIFGAAALAGMKEERALATLDLVVSHGVNHIDTAASYGAAEDRLKPWLAEHRDEVFLATKTAERSGPAAREELERSLDRMGVDSIDLIQLHNLVEEDEWAAAHAPGGAVEALFRARDEGLVHHVGVTGHGLRIPRMHLRSLERANFESVLFPFNHALVSIPEYRREVEELLSVCRDRSVATQTIKAIARRRWGASDAPRFSWYEPLIDPGAIARAVRYVLSRDGLFLNTTSDARLLPLVLEAAQGALFAPSDAEMVADADTFGVAPLFDGGELERI